MIPSRKQVEYYVNSSNFGRNTNSYFQFLVLSHPAGLIPKEVNQKVLNNHGELTGKAQAFIDAGKEFNLNEAYLISHALLETGNGKSILARESLLIKPEGYAKKKQFRLYIICTA